MRPYRIQSRLVSSSWFDNGRPPPRRPVGTHGLCVHPRQSETSSRSFDNGRSDRASLQDSSLCVHCVKSYSVVVLTGTDALSLDTLERPYRIQSRLVSSSWFDNGRPPPTSSCRDARSVRPLRQRLQRRGFNGNGRSDRASLQDSVTASLVSIVRGRTLRPSVPTGCSSS